MGSRARARGTRPLRAELLLRQHASQRNYYFDSTRLIGSVEDVLHRHGLEIPVGRSLERLAISLITINDDFFRQAQDDPTTDRRPLYTQAAGIVDLTQKILRAAEHREFDKLVPHLRLLTHDNTEIVQNFFSRREDEVSNKVFELYLGLLVLAADGHDLEMDDPDASSGGRNPDVIVSFGSRRWGFAAKILHSQNPQQYGALVESGARQIEVADVDCGIVVVNFKNIVPHDTLWPVHRRVDGQIDEYFVYDHWQQIDVGLETFFQTNIFHGIIDDWGGREEIARFWDQFRKALPSTLNLLPTVAATMRPEGWAPTKVNKLIHLPFRTPTQELMELLDRLNHVTQQQ